MGIAPRRLHTSLQRGMSLIDLLMSVTIALFIALAGTTLLAANLREDRSLLLEARLMQDLRTATDVVTRDLRRAGYWAGAARSGDASIANPYSAVSPTAGPSDTVTFQYSRDDTENNAVDINEQFGFRLHNAAIEIQLGNGNWQALTDAQNLRVTAFTVTPNVQDIALQAFCASACTSIETSRTGSTCPPHQQVRSLDVIIKASLAADVRVVRTLRSTVRLRNDAIVGSCAI
jgi:prepilin peptidase dependent protein B